MARALSKECLLNNPRFIKECSRLYGEKYDFEAERYSSLTEGMNGKLRFFSASGRAEFIGNHTDHNHGFVIASAIDMDAAAAVEPSDGDEITIESIGYPSFSVKLSDDTIDEKEFGTSKAILKGVIKGLLDRGRKVGAFRARIHSTVCKGAGVSSSASFELLLCEIFNALYNDNAMDFKEMAIISQFAENVYFGKPSGLMDQLTASHGGVSFMDFFDPSAPKAKSLEWKFDDVGLVIINCGGDHCDLTDEYAAIRSDMHAVANFFGKEVLREVDKDEFFARLPELKNNFDGRAILRAIHFFEEDDRVNLAYDALAKDDKETFLRLITESGNSSYDLLQNCYPKGDTVQPIPLALAIAKRNEKTLATRVHGGGFAGTIISFVAKKDIDSYVEYMKKFFGEDSVFGVSVRNAGATELVLED